VRLPPWLPEGGPNATFFRALEEVLPEDADRAVWEVLSLLEAEGPWLDLHGELYGFSRDLGEADEDYRQRILAEITTPRQTRAAIKAAVERAGTRIADGSGVVAHVIDQASGNYLATATLRALDGAWTLDGGATLGGNSLLALLAPPTPPRFLVLLEGNVRDLRPAERIVERMRAAGCIPEYGAALEAGRARAGLEASGTRELLLTYQLDGTHQLDGTWVLDYNSQGVTSL